MNLTALLLQEFKAEAATTLRVLGEIKNEILDFSPHQKSKTVLDLANHMLLIPSWVVPILEGSEFDWAAYTPPAAMETKEALVVQYQEYVTAAIEALEKADDTILQEPWTMKNGDFTFFTIEKHQAIRNLVLNHTVHHRAQMGVNLRLNDLKVPATYVSSADENLFA
ncbi:DinB family protein [Spongiimicrobium salis]|uniref:DinB family protein n=1 Tax=Spongiimicrobium salis TaxID=1667022 RepID=UPI00374D400C